MFPSRHTAACRAAAPRPRFRPRLEPLEARAVPSANFWDGGGDGRNWFDARNWSDDELPDGRLPVYVFGDVVGGTVVYAPPADASANALNFGDVYFFGGIGLNVAAGSMTVSGYFSGYGLSIAAGASFTLGNPAGFNPGAFFDGNLRNDGTFRLTGSAGEGSYVGITGLFRNAGQFVWDGDVGLRFGSDAPAGQGGFHNTGTALFLGGGTVSAFDPFFGEGGPSFAALASHVPALPQSPPSGLPAYAVLNDGLLISGGAADNTFELFGSWENRGVLAIESGTLRVLGNLIQTAGGTRLGTAAGETGTLDLEVPAADAGTVPGVLLLQGGTLSGIGTVDGHVYNTGGILAPGFSPGLLRVTGDYLQTAGGSAVFEVAGHLPGIGHDQLAVGGSATLAGTLRVVTAGGFVPSPGDVFVLVVAGVVTGTFDVLLGTGLPEGLYFEPFTSPSGFGVAVRGSIPADPPPAREADPAPVAVLAPVRPPAPGIGFVVIPDATMTAVLAGLPANSDEFVMMPLLAPPDDAAELARRRAAADEFGYGMAYRRNGVAALPGEISGRIFTDLDGDGRQTEGEPYRPGQVVFLDVDGDGVRDEGEPFTVTDAGGAFRFRDLWPGHYAVRIELGPKSEQTLPKEPVRTIMLTAEMRAADDADFAVNDRRLARQARPASRPKVARPASEESGTPVPEMVGAVLLAFRRPRRPARRARAA